MAPFIAERYFVAWLSFSMVLDKLVNLENIFVSHVTLWTVGVITQMQIK